ncbi:hypothetical protein T484DRAFT_1765775, partial [Baffinella frigidus]
ADPAAASWDGKGGDEAGGGRGGGGLVAAAMESGSWGTLSALAGFVREEIGAESWGMICTEAGLLQMSGLACITPSKQAGGKQYLLGKIFAWGRRLGEATIQIGPFVCVAGPEPFEPFAEQLALEPFLSLDDRALLGHVAAAASLASAPVKVEKESEGGAGKQKLKRFMRARQPFPKGKREQVERDSTVQAAQMLLLTLARRSGVALSAPLLVSLAASLHTVHETLPRRFSLAAAVVAARRKPHGHLPSGTPSLNAQAVRFLSAFTPAAGPSALAPEAGPSGLSVPEAGPSGISPPEAGPSVGVSAPEAGPGGVSDQMSAGGSLFALLGALDFALRNLNALRSRGGPGGGGAEMVFRGGPAPLLALRMACVDGDEVLARALLARRMARPLLNQAPPDPAHRAAAASRARHGGRGSSLFSTVAGGGLRGPKVSCLHLALSGGHWRLARMLLDDGADAGVGWTTPHGSPLASALHSFLLFAPPSRPPPRAPRTPALLQDGPASEVKDGPASRSQDRPASGLGGGGGGEGPEVGDGAARVVGVALQDEPASGLEGRALEGRRGAARGGVALQLARARGMRLELAPPLGALGASGGDGADKGKASTDDLLGLEEVAVALLERDDAAALLPRLPALLAAVRAGATTFLAALFRRNLTSPLSPASSHALQTALASRVAAGAGGGTAEMLVTLADANEKSKGSQAASELSFEATALLAARFGAISALRSSLRQLTERQAGSGAGLAGADSLGRPLLFLAALSGDAATVSFALDNGGLPLAEADTLRVVRGRDGDRQQPWRTHALGFALWRCSDQVIALLLLRAGGPLRSLVMKKTPPQRGASLDEEQDAASDTSDNDSAKKETSVGPASGSEPAGSEGGWGVWGPGGMSAWHAAVAKGRVQVVRDLLLAGVSPDQAGRDARGCTPRDYVPLAPLLPARFPLLWTGPLQDEHALATNGSNDAPASEPKANDGMSVVDGRFMVWNPFFGALLSEEPRGLNPADRPEGGGEGDLMGREAAHRLLRDLLRFDLRSRGGGGGLTTWRKKRYATAASGRIAAQVMAAAAGVGTQRDLEVGMAFAAASGNVSAWKWLHRRAAHNAWNGSKDSIATHLAALATQSLWVAAHNAQEAIALLALSAHAAGGGEEGHAPAARALACAIGPGGAVEPGGSKVEGGLSGGNDAAGGEGARARGLEELVLVALGGGCGTLAAELLRACEGELPGLSGVAAARIAATAIALGHGWLVEAWAESSAGIPLALALPLSQACPSWRPLLRSVARLHPPRPTPHRQAPAHGQKPEHRQAPAQQGGGAEGGGGGVWSRRDQGGSEGWGERGAGGEGGGEGGWAWEEERVLQRYDTEVERVNLALMSLVNSFSLLPPAPPDDPEAASTRPSLPFPHPAPFDLDLLRDVTSSSGDGLVHESRPGSAVLPSAVTWLRGGYSGAAPLLPSEYGGCYRWPPEEAIVAARAAGHWRDSRWRENLPPAPNFDGPDNKSDAASDCSEAFTGTPGPGAYDPETGVSLMRQRISLEELDKFANSLA